MDGYGALRGGGRGIGRALDFDPLSSPISANLAAAYCFARQYDRALEQIHKTVSSTPRLSPPALHAVLPRAGVLRPRRRGGAEELPFLGMSSGQDHPGNGHAIAGRAEEAMKIAGELENQPQLLERTSGLPNIYGALEITIGR